MFKLMLLGKTFHHINFEINNGLLNVSNIELLQCFWLLVLSPLVVKKPEVDLQVQGEPVDKHHQVWKYLHCLTQCKYHCIPVLIVL